MYANISSQKKINFFFLSGLMLACLFLSFAVWNRFASSYSLSNLSEQAGMALQSLKYDLLYGGNAASVTASSTDAISPTRDHAIDVPVLVYHGMVNSADRFSMTTQTFSDQMFALKAAGYRTISMDDFEQFINGTKTLPDKSFLLTFDDGRRDSWVGADPVLKATGFHAVMFVATGDSLPSSVKEGGYYLTSADLQKMIDSGRWELGSHAIQANTAGGEIPTDANGTMGNFLSNKMWLKDKNRLETDDEYKARVTHELEDSKAALQSTFGITVSALSYPFSDYGEQTLNNPNAISVISDIMHQTYSVAFQQTWPSDSSYILNYPDMDPYHLRRIETGPTWSGSFLVKLLDTGRAKPLPYTDTFENDNGWRGTWGEKYFSGNMLHLNAPEDTNGAFVFLDGTREWDDYMYSVETFLEKGSRISLITRFTDSSNNAACVFGSDAVRIEQKLNGVTTVLAQSKNTVAVAYPTAMLAVKVEGGTIQCFEGSRLALSANNLSPKLVRGGIALQVWDAAKNNASLYINTLKAVPVSDAQSLRNKLPNYPLK